MKRVLFLTRSLQRAPGGMQTQAKELITALRARPDIHLTVVGHSGGRWTLPLFACRAVAAVLCNAHDTVHLGDASLSFLLPVVALLRPKKRRTCTVHGLDLLWRFPGYRLFLRRTLSLAHRIAAVSTATKDVAVQLGISPDRIVIIPCGIQIQTTVASERTTNVLLTLGRLVPRKGIAWFAREVFPSLDPSVRWIIAGTGREESSIRAATAPYRDRVQMLGEIHEQKKEELLGECSSLLVPNVPIKGDMEGFGIVCIEAASRGLPVVAARLEGLTDAVIENVTGTFFEPSDAGSAKAAVESALSMSFDPIRMISTCREYFGIDNISSRYARDVF